MTTRVWVSSSLAQVTLEESGKPKTTFARKNRPDDSGADSSVDVEAGAGTNIARRPSLVSSYQVSRTNSFADSEHADLLIIAAVNNTASYDATDRSVVIGDASVSWPTACSCPGRRDP